MANEQQTLTPPMMWAQRKNLVFLTICVEDCVKPTLDIEATKLHFKGNGGADKKPYEVTIEFYKEIDTESSKTYVRDRSIELLLRKKEEGPYWPQLSKDKKKIHLLKIDFNRWRDEDDSEQEEENEEEDLDSMMRRMGGLSQDGEKMNMDDLGSDEEEDDDGDLPDLE